MNTRTAVNTAITYLDTYKIRFMGTWASGTTYLQNDFVIYSGASYIGVGGGNTANTPSGVSIYWVQLPGGGSAWGAITGTLSNQTDLGTALSGKEPTITAGSTSQYWRGDKTWQTLNTSGVTESGNLYFTNARAVAAMAGLYQTPITTGTTSQYFRGDLSLATFPTTWAWANLTGVPTLTNTVFGRSGTVAATNGDYNSGQVTESTNLYFTNARAQSALAGLYVPFVTPGAAGHYLRSNGSAYVDSALLAGDAPTWNQSTTGNAATATALAALPTPCSTGNAPTGILANGNATGCTGILTATSPFSALHTSFTPYFNPEPSVTGTASYTDYSGSGSTSTYQGPGLASYTEPVSITRASIYVSTAFTATCSATPCITALQLSIGTASNAVAYMQPVQISQTITGISCIGSGPSTATFTLLGPIAPASQTPAVTISGAITSSGSYNQTASATWTSSTTFTETYSGACAGTYTANSGSAGLVGLIAGGLSSGLQQAASGSDTMYLWLTETNPNPAAFSTLAGGAVKVQFGGVQLQ